MSASLGKYTDVKGLESELTRPPTSSFVRLGFKRSSATAQNTVESDCLVSCNQEMQLSHMLTSNTASKERLA